MLTYNDWFEQHMGIGGTPADYATEYARYYHEQLSKWISVSERLPEKEGEYIVVKKGVVSTLDYDNEVWYSDILDCPIDGITHWQPLPKKP